jgi:hypothetical protein
MIYNIQHMVQVILLLIFASWGLYKLADTARDLLMDPEVRSIIQSMLPKRKNLALSLATKRDLQQQLLSLRG